MKKMKEIERNEQRGFFFRFYCLKRIKEGNEKQEKTQRE